MQDMLLRPRSERSTSILLGGGSNQASIWSACWATNWHLAEIPLAQSDNRTCQCWHTLVRSLEEFHCQAPAATDRNLSAKALPSLFAGIDNETFWNDMVVGLGSQFQWPRAVRNVANGADAPSLYVHVPCLSRALLCWNRRYFSITFRQNTLLFVWLYNSWINI